RKTNPCKKSGPVSQAGSPTLGDDCPSGNAPGTSGSIRARNSPNFSNSASTAAASNPNVASAVVGNVIVTVFQSSSNFKSSLVIPHLAGCQARKQLGNKNCASLARAISTSRDGTPCSTHCCPPCTPWPDQKALNFFAFHLLHPNGVDLRHPAVEQAQG